MIKSATEFFATGILVVVFYTLYFITAAIATVFIGLPIGLGIKMIIDLIEIIYSGTNTLVY
jgi:hypothetical protein